MYLASDEAIIANDAYAIATTGRTLDGVFLPLYVYVPTQRQLVHAVYLLLDGDLAAAAAAGGVVDPRAHGDHRPRRIWSSPTASPASCSVTARSR